MKGVALALVGVRLALLAGQPQNARAQEPVVERIRENRERLEAIRVERDQLQSELDRLRGRAHSISGELANLERQAAVTNQIVNELDRQIGSMRGQLDTLTLELLLAEDNVTEKQAVLERRVSDIYKRGPMWAFEVMLAAESFGDLLSRYKYLYLATRHDQALVGDVRDLRDRIASQRRQSVNVRQELGRQRDERGLELTRYQRLERARSRSLRQTRVSERQAEKRLDSLARDEDRLNDILAALERARRRSLATGGNVEGRLTEGTIHTSDLGSLNWPAEGPVRYQFGRFRRPDGTHIRYNGIGIGTPVGTPVHSIERGTIRVAEPLNTYGPTVVVDHGGGFYTLYLYLSRVDVSVGQVVDAGAVVGLSGGENSDEGPHLEFQIRGEGGIALDPVNWLKNRR